MFISLHWKEMDMMHLSCMTHTKQNDKCGVLYWGVYGSNHYMFEVVDKKKLFMACLQYGVTVTVLAEAPNRKSIENY